MSRTAHCKLSTTVMAMLRGGGLGQYLCSGTLIVIISIVCCMIIDYVASLQNIILSAVIVVASRCLVMCFLKECVSGQEIAKNVLVKMCQLRST